MQDNNQSSRNSELESILKNTNAGTWIYDVKTGKTKLNKRWAKMLGYKLEELEPTDVHTWKDRVHPEDLKIAEQKLEEHLQGKSKKYSCEIRMKHKDGYWIWVHDMGKINSWNDDGEPLTMTGSHIEITKHKQTEEELLESNQKLENFISNLPGIAFKCKNDAHWTMEYLSPQTFEITGYHTEELLDNEEISFAAILHEDDQQYVADEVEKYFQKGDTYEIEYRIRRKDGEIIWASEKGVGIRPDGKNIEFIEGIILDITRRKEVEQKLSAAKEKAEESDRLKSAFLATMNHELRTPLNHVLGFAQLIPDMTEDENIKELSNLIHKSGSSLQNIIEDIFDLAMIEQSEVKVRSERVRIEGLCLEIKKLLKETLAESNKEDSIDLHYHTDENILKKVIYTDQSKILQVISNLVKNAIKFTDKGEISMEFKIHEDGFFSIQVKDTGIGIAKDKQKMIFNFFRQVDDSNTRKFGGIGIGLAISKRIANSMDGEIILDSSLGEGSTFTCRFPLINKPDEELNQDFEINLETPDLLEKQILIVEDDKIGQEMIASMLTFTGCNILKSNNGAEAINEIEKNKDIDLVLMDLKMPIMDGYTATTKIREKNKDLPIIAFSAYNLQEDKYKALNSGCNDIMTKPVNKEVLYKTLKKHVLKQA